MLTSTRQICLLSSNTCPLRHPPARKPSARDRLLAAADELFYAEGVHTVGIDRIIERAGVAKASLYSTLRQQGRR